MATPKDELVFNYDWLSLDKAEIELICYLLLNDGLFVGSLSELCRAVGRSDNTKSRNGRQQVIDRLCALGIIVYSKQTARTIKITLVVPKEEGKISIERQHLESIMRREYERSVAWQQVLKGYLWLKKCGNGPLAFRRCEAAAALGVCNSTITEAMRVLADHYGAISLERIGYLDEEGSPRCAGLEAELSAFWTTD